MYILLHVYKKMTLSVMNHYLFISSESYLVIHIIRFNYYLQNPAMTEPTSMLPLQGTNLTSYVTVTEHDLTDVMKSSKWGIAPLLDDTLLSQITHLQRQQGHLIVLIYLLKDFTIGHAHMISQIKPRGELSQEYTSLPLPEHWQYIFKIKWVGVSCIDITRVDSMIPDALQDSWASRPDVSLVPEIVGADICSLLSAASDPRQYWRKGAPKSLTKYDSYEKYMQQMNSSDKSDLLASHMAKSVDTSMDIDERSDIKALVSEYNRTRKTKAWSFSDIESTFISLVRDMKGVTVAFEIVGKEREKDVLERCVRALEHTFVAEASVSHASIFCEQLIFWCKGKNLLLKRLAQSIKGNIHKLLLQSHSTRVLRAAVVVFPSPGRELIAREIRAILKESHTSLSPHTVSVARDLLHFHAKFLSAIAEDLLEEDQNVHGLMTDISLVRDFLDCWKNVSDDASRYKILNYLCRRLPKYLGHVPTLLEYILPLIEDATKISIEEVNHLQVELLKSYLEAEQCREKLPLATVDALTEGKQHLFNTCHTSFKPLFSF